MVRVCASRKSLIKAPPKKMGHSVVRRFLWSRKTTPLPTFMETMGLLVKLFREIQRWD